VVYGGRLREGMNNGVATMVLRRLWLVLVDMVGSRFKRVLYLALCVFDLAIYICLMVGVEANPERDSNLNPAL
jgi:hypothetical protein